jgi:molybdenum cofactor synthesis domain-containing protein
MGLEVGILTVSDRSSQGLRSDQSGPALAWVVESGGWQVARHRIVPDERSEIKKTLLEWCDLEGLALILTTGGTGLGPRDVTPEATREVLDKELPGLSGWMLLEGAKKNLRSLLSREMAGSRGHSLIINLPGNPMGAVESLSLILPLIPHALAVLEGAGHLEERSFHGAS